MAEEHVDRGVLKVAEAMSYGPDPRQRLDVYRPDATLNGLPVIVFCYGGAWDSGAREYYEFAGRAFARAGYIAIVFDYRLVPQARFPAFVEDTASVIAWATNHAGDYGGNGSEVYLVGHSAGAHIVSFLAVYTPSFYRRHITKR